MSNICNPANVALNVCFESPSASLTNIKNLLPVILSVSYLVAPIVFTFTYFDLFFGQSHWFIENITKCIHLETPQSVEMTRTRKVVLYFKNSLKCILITPQEFLLLTSLLCFSFLSSASYCPSSSLRFVRIDFNKNQSVGAFKVTYLSYLLTVSLF